MYFTITLAAMLFCIAALVLVVGTAIVGTLITKDIWLPRPVGIAFAATAIGVVTSLALILCGLAWLTFSDPGRFLAVSGPQLLGLT